MKERIIVLQHVAIIPDGNRRWAKKHGLTRWISHRKAGDYNNLILLFNEAKNLDIKYLSIWGFSTENWKRTKTEVNEILKVISKGIDDATEKADENRTCFKHIGRKDRLPKDLIRKLENLEQVTKKFKSNFVLLCLDYGGRDETIRTVNKLLNKKLKKINEKKFPSYLDTAGIPNPDLIIRTGGEKRLSGFMPYQSDYAELYFTDVYFPDFRPKELKEAVEEFSRRQRRFGR